MRTKKVFETALRPSIPDMHDHELQPDADAAAKDARMEACEPVCILPRDHWWVEKDGKTICERCGLIFKT